MNLYLHTIYFKTPVKLKRPLENLYIPQLYKTGKTAIGYLNKHIPSQRSELRP